MQSVAAPALLIDTGASPHTYALTPSKRALLEDADLIVGIGPSMEAGVWDAIEEIDTAHLALMENGEAHQADEPQTHAHGEDPHVWFDTHLVAEMAEHISEILSEIDPQNAPLYASNLTAFETRVEELEGEIAQQLNGLQGVAVNYHDAFGHFARQWNLGYDFIVPEPDTAPSAGKVAAIRELAAAGEVGCLMTEPQFAPDLLVQLAGDYNLLVIEIDPEGALVPEGPDAWFVLMRETAAAFAACLAPH
jgi:zinc transport system substrate-binding protein